MSKKIWICTACAKRSNDRVGNKPIDLGWDVSCFMNAIEMDEDKANELHDEYYRRLKGQGDE